MIISLERNDLQEKNSVLINYKCVQFHISVVYFSYSLLVNVLCTSVIHYW